MLRQSFSTVVAGVIFLLIYFLGELHLGINFQSVTTTVSQLFHQEHSKPFKLIPPNPVIPQPPSGSALHVYASAAICSDSNVCSSIGKNALLKGGSAVDAALATLLCNGLITMQSMGLGGGVLLNIYVQSEQRAYSILGREVAPLALNAVNWTTIKSSEELHKSGLTIALPTELMAYGEAHARFGKLPWMELVQPTVAICHKGFKLSKHQRDALLSNSKAIATDKLLKQMFFNTTTEDFYRVGAHIKPPAELCLTYEVLAAQGVNSFYKKDLARSVVKDLNDLGSTINEIDLTTLKVGVVPSVVFHLGDYLLHLPPPPGSGHIIGFVMNILKNFEVDFLNAKTINALAIHRIVEALKFGFAKRWQLDTQSDEALIFNLTCPQYAQKLANLINDFHTSDDLAHYGVNKELIPQLERGTAHISVLAANGDAVSATSSINFYFGSGRTGTRTGIIFNNAMADFSIPGIPNYFNLQHVKNKNRITPGQSPMSSMAPIIVSNKNGDVRLVVGAAGGSKIISVLTQILVRTLWLGEDIKQAIDAARFHHQLLPDMLEYEYGILEQQIADLEQRRHQTERYRVRGSAVCGIERLHSGATIRANVDYRKDGGAAGY